MKFIPIIHHSSHHHGHGHVSGGEAVIIVLVFTLIIYWAVVLVKLSYDDYETKREFYLDLIPFRVWFIHFKEKLTDLE